MYSRSLIHSSTSSSLLFISSGVFLNSVIEFFVFAWFFFMFSFSLLRVLVGSSTLYSSPVSILMTITLNLLSCITYLHFAYLSCCDFCPIFSFRTYSSFSSFWLTVCICFFVRKVLYLLLLKVMVWWRKGPMVPYSTMSHVYQNLVPEKCFLYVLHVPYWGSWATFAYNPVMQWLSLPVMGKVWSLCC